MKWNAIRAVLTALEAHGQNSALGAPTYTITQEYGRVFIGMDPYAREATGNCPAYQYVKTALDAGMQ